MNKTIPRGWLGTSAGVFSLHESDHSCGSYITVEDAAQILSIEPNALMPFPTVKHGNKYYLTDQQLGRAWASGVIDSPRSQYRRGDAMISFDELIVMALFEITLPGALIEPQYMIGNRIADFKVSYGNKLLIVEFFGPYHFINRSYRVKPLVDPRKSRRDIERQTRLECVIWPYWVQRCSSNVKALFDRDVQGIGSIWSTSAHFGDFAFADSADVIIDINNRFKIEQKDGIGYMYTDEVVAKPVHPIIKRIREGKDEISKLIPPGAKNSPKYWLPKQLWPLVV